MDSSEASDTYSWGNRICGDERADLLVMHVIFQNISTSRCGYLSMELEAPYVTA